MQRLSYPSETLLSNIIKRNIIVLSFKYYPRKPLGRRPSIARIPTVIFVSISGAGRREGGGRESSVVVVVGTEGVDLPWDSAVR